LSLFFLRLLYDSTPFYCREVCMGSSGVGVLFVFMNWTRVRGNLERGVSMNGTSISLVPVQI
jgi:hypothetical protein